MSTIRFKFSRNEALRFISHLDQQRLFQRAFRRAGLSIAHSNGFNPHPKLAFALAMSVGLISDSEYGDVTLEEDIELMEFVKRINSALPNGLMVTEAQNIPSNQTSLSASITSSQYEIEVDFSNADGSQNIERVVSDYLMMKEIIFQKRNKKGKVVPKDIRPFIGDIAVSRKDEKTVVLLMTLFYIEQQCIKPELILQNINEQVQDIFKVDPTIVMYRKALTIR